VQSLYIDGLALILVLINARGGNPPRDCRRAIEGVDLSDSTAIVE